MKWRTSRAVFQSALPMKGATVFMSLTAIRRAFQSALPMKGATLEPGEPEMGSHISIRAPNEGSDGASRRTRQSPRHFNPRSQRRERRELLATIKVRDPFQSALPKKGATWREDKESYGTANFNPRSQRRERQQSYIFAAKIYRISIRAPKEGSDA